MSIRDCALFSLWNSPHHDRPKTAENKKSNVRYNRINITIPDWVIVENIIPRNMIINLPCASVDNHIPRDDIFDYHQIRECNIYIILHSSKILILLACSIAVVSMSFQSEWKTVDPDLIALSKRINLGSTGPVLRIPGNLHFTGMI